MGTSYSLCQRQRDTRLFKTILKVDFFTLHLFHIFLLSHPYPSLLLQMLSLLQTDSWDTLYITLPQTLFWCYCPQCRVPFFWDLREMAWRQPQSYLSRRYAVAELFFSEQVSWESCRGFGVFLPFCFSYLVLLLLHNCPSGEPGCSGDLCCQLPHWSTGANTA